MLVLTRRRGEGVTLGPDIRVVVLSAKGGQVRLGIDAPKNVEIHRDEVHARVLAENHLAAQTRVIPLEAFRRLAAAKRSCPE